MKNELAVFKNEYFGEIRTLNIAGELYFVGKDVAKALGYHNIKEALSKYVDDEDKNNMAIHEESKNTIMINENGLYSLVISSKSSTAKQFQNWVTSDVIPSIKQNQPQNEVLPAVKLNQTPIEILLKVDEEGKTTAKALYEFLELDASHYARWCKKNILGNNFAEENVDFWTFNMNVEWGGQATTDYKLTASFAKKLAMSCQNEKGEQAREYFLKVEDMLKKTVNKKQLSDDEKQQKLELAKQKLELQKEKLKVMDLNAKTRAFNSIMKSMEKHKNLSPVAVEVFGLKAMESVFGAEIGNALPQVEKTYTATEVGKMLGISACKVGRLANKYNLKTQEYGIYVLDETKEYGENRLKKQVESFRYNENGVRALQEAAN